MSYVILILFLLSPQVTTGNLLLISTLPPKMVPVTVKIDFGPAQKSSVSREIVVPEKITPKDALRKVLPVVDGAACCKSEEVKAIDGVAIDPAQNRWWRLKINGTTKNASPYKSHLKAGDLVEWEYFEDLQ
ncbi:MAG: DUF4430 domain-containing protein [Candidatus Omnitrophica bacterium]|nr:DUF4430 domain-containing protein [Candidatus Omnitrophota bacterium]